MSRSADVSKQAEAAVLAQVRAGMAAFNPSKDQQYIKDLAVLKALALEGGGRQALQRAAHKADNLAARLTKDLRTIRETACRVHGLFLAHVRFFC